MSFCNSVTLILQIKRINSKKKKPGTRFRANYITKISTVLETKNSSLMEPEKVEEVKEVKDAEEWKVKGNNAFKERNWVEAKNCFTKAIEIDPNNEVFYRLFPLCLTI